MSAPMNAASPTTATVILLAVVVAVVLARSSSSSSSQPSFVPTWKNNNIHRPDDSSTFAARAYDSDINAFRRMKYQYDAANKWSNSNNIGRRQQRSDRPAATSLWSSNNRLNNLMDKASSFIKDNIASSTATDLEQNSDDAISTFMEEERKKGIGKVLRVAARPFMKEKSRPGRPGYTTRKNSMPHIVVDKAGVNGDYNDYRSRALASTPDRAVSILTSDVLAYVRDESRYSSLQDGDLGENIFVDGISYTFFEVGKRYRFSRKNPKEAGGGGGAGGANAGDVGGGGVIVEITEPAVPCANLCNLEFINSSFLEPRQRIEKCQSFVEKLGIDDGFRGWYAKVIGGGGMIRPGDSVALLSG